MGDSMNKWTQHQIFKHVFSVLNHWSLSSSVLSVYGLILKLPKYAIFSNNCHNFLDEGIGLQEDVQD